MPAPQVETALYSVEIATFPGFVKPAPRGGDMVRPQVINPPMHLQIQPTDGENGAPPGRCRSTRRGNFSLGFRGASVTRGA